MARKLKVKDQKPVIRRAARRRICGDDIEAISKLVSLQISETEACLNLDIKPQTWFDWKKDHRHSSQFSESLTRARGAKLAMCMERIQTLGEERKDWRAFDKIAGYAAPERYAQAQSPSQVSLNVNLVAPDRLKQLVEMLADGKVRAAIGLGDCTDIQSKVVDAVEPAQLNISDVVHP